MTTALAKKPGDSAAQEVPGELLELVAQQVIEGRYAPRRRSLAALPGELPGMLAAALVPVGVALAAVGMLRSAGPFGVVSGAMLWLVLAATAWWLAFLSVERVADRLSGLPPGAASRRQALARAWPGLKSFLWGYAALYFMGLAGLQALFGSPYEAADLTLAMPIYVGLPAFLMAPWAAARGLSRARFRTRDPAAEALAGIARQAVGPVLVVPGFLGESLLRRKAEVGLVQAVPSTVSLDLLGVGSPLLHLVLLGVGVLVLGLVAPPLYLGLLGLGAVHVQHELAVLAETEAGVAARDCGHLRELGLR